MLQYKTIAIPNPVIKGKFYKDFTQEKAQESIQDISSVIQSESSKGFILHSIETIEKRIVRKKKLPEKFFGWIPFLGNYIFPTMREECGYGRQISVNVLVFVKEI